MPSDLSIALNFALGGFLLVLPVAILLWERRANRRRAGAAYREAAVLALATEQVVRDLPVFERANTRVRFSHGTCACSRVPLDAPRGPAFWSLKVERRRSGIAGGGWWHLREREGELPPDVVERLKAEIERCEQDGGFLEFEGDRRQVIAWWNDAEGPDEAHRIAAALRDVARMLDAHGADRVAS